jgi:hypothetical protein
MLQEVSIIIWDARVVGMLGLEALPVSFQRRRIHAGAELEVDYL